MFCFVVTSKSKMISIGSIFRRKFSFIKTELEHSFLRLFKKNWQFCCTGLLRSSKVVYLHAKKYSSFYLEFKGQFNEPSSSFLKPAKPKQYLKNVHLRYASAKGYSASQDSKEKPKAVFVRHFYL